MTRGGRQSADRPTNVHGSVRYRRVCQQGV